MKALKSIFAVLLAAAMVFGFASCSDDDDEDDSPSAVATFKDEKHDESIVFYSDKSFAYKDSSVTLMTGSYTGDPTTASSTVTVTLAKVAKGFFDDSENTALVDITDEALTTLDLTSKEVPVTISADGKTASFLGTDYTKQ